MTPLFTHFELLHLFRCKTPPILEQRMTKAWNRFISAVKKWEKAHPTDAFQDFVMSFAHPSSSQLSYEEMVRLRDEYRVTHSFTGLDMYQPVRPPSLPASSDGYYLTTRPSP